MIVGWILDVSLAPRPVGRPVAGSWISGGGAGPAVADASHAADPPSWPTADPDRELRWLGWLGPIRHALAPRPLRADRSRALQDWRYGISHYIYEYTHPHLAKYAMALGIIAWGDDRVTSTSDLAVAVRDAAIEPRWDDPTMPDHRAGDRLYVATGSGVRVYDL